MVKMYCEDMDHPGYLAHDAARLVGVSGDRIGQWARWGHIRASISDGDPHVYSWDDVADALAVHLLLDAGHSLPAIRRAVERAGRLSGGGDVFSAFGALPLNGRVDAVALLRRGGWPCRSADLGVCVDPTVMGGQPCVRGRRVLVRDVVVDPGAYGISEEEGAAVLRWWECSPS